MCKYICQRLENLTVIVYYSYIKHSNLTHINLLSEQNKKSNAL